MAKVVIKIPELKVYSINQDTFYDVTKITDREYSCTVTLPPNTTDEDIIYKFEAYANNEPSGLIATVTVKTDTIIEYAEISQLYASPDELGPEGGETTIYIRFDDISNLPVIKTVNIPYMFRGTVVEKFISSKGEIYISTDATDCGVWKYNKTTNELNHVLSTGQNWNNFYEASNGTIYIGSRDPDVLGLYRIIPDADIAEEISNLGSQWLTHCFESNNNEFVYIDVYSEDNGICLFRLNTNTGDLDPCLETEIDSSIIDFWGDWCLRPTRILFSSTNHNFQGLYEIPGNTDGEDGIPSTIITKFLDMGADYKFSDLTPGSIYASTANDTFTGLVIIDDFDDIARTIEPDGDSYDNFMKTSLGNIYFSSNNSANDGIWKISPEIGPVKVYDTGWSGCKFYEGKDGTLYVLGSSITPIGIWKVSQAANTLNDFVASAECITPSGVVDVLLETTNGTIFFTSLDESDYVMYKYNTSYTYSTQYLAPIITSNNALMRYAFEASDGYTYLSSDDASYPGVYRANDNDMDDLTQVYDHGYNWLHWEESNGVISAVSSNEDGEIVLNTETNKFEVNNLVPSNYSWNPHGKVSLFSDNTPKTRVWYNKRLFLELDEEYVSIESKGDVCIANISGSDPSNLLIIY